MADTNNPRLLTYLPHTCFQGPYAEIKLSIYSPGGGAENEATGQEPSHALTTVLLHHALTLSYP